MKNKAIILLSGGLDSVVALGYLQNKTDCDIQLALTFDYGQKSVEAEIKASEKIADYYNIKHKVIKLDWLAEITNTSLVGNSAIPECNFEDKKTAEAVWVPNRNGLFLNIAASFCDSFGYNYIIYGANKDEAEKFPDNTEAFRSQVSKCFETSTLVQPKILAPLINYTKNDIVKIAIENQVPLEYIRSCYNSGNGHCGKCESCYNLLRALEANNCKEYINIMFNNYEN